MFKLDEIAPEISARMAKQQAEQEAHQAECIADPCERCRRYPKPPPSKTDLWTADAERLIPAVYADASVDASWLTELVGHPAIERAKISITSPRAVFVGPAGAGKSSLAVAMLRHALETSRPPTPWTPPARHRFVSAHALAKARALHPLGAGEAPLVHDALRASILLIDDVGAEDARYGSAVKEIIYERHAHALPTWVTTGVGPKELAQRYDGGIARRLFEGATVFKLGGKR